MVHTCEGSGGTRSGSTIITVGHRFRVGSQTSDDTGRLAVFAFGGLVAEIEKDRKGCILMMQ